MRAIGLPDGVRHTHPQMSAGRDFGTAHWRFQHAFRSLLDDALSGSPVTRAEYGALAICHSQNGTTGSELARELLITRQAAGRTIARLVDAGLACAEPAERGPARKANLTPHGEAVLQEADRLVTAALAKLLAPLAVSERELLIEMMSRCADAAGRDGT
jgi:DNA-binding MarR family transcriptional regulator